MGDRLNNNRVPHQRSQAAASFGSNNVSGRSDITLADARPRPPAGPLASAQKSETASLTAFLQAFPSLEEVYRKFPEFENLTLPDTIDDKTVESFERLLESVLEPARYNGLTNSHAPADILRGLSELRTRQDGGKAVPARHGRSEAADRPPEDKRGAGRLRRPRATLPNYLMNRETGSRPHPGDGLPHRFAAVRQDRLASMAIAMNCDIEVLQKCEPDKSYNKAELLEKSPFQAQWIQRCEEHFKLIIARGIDDRVGKACKKFLNVDKKTYEFFSELFRRECMTSLQDHLRRFSDEISDIGPWNSDGEEDRATPFNDAVARFDADIPVIVLKEVKKIVLSMLAFNECRAGTEGRNEFQKAFVPAIATLYKTNNFSEASATFKEYARADFDRIVSRKSEKTTGPIVMEKAYSIVVGDQVKELFSYTKSFTDECYEFAKEIAFYICCCNKEDPPSAMLVAAAIANFFLCSLPPLSS